MTALTNYWKQLGPVVAIVLVVANLLGPQWKPGYAIAAVCAALINLFGPPNTKPTISTGTVDKTPASGPTAVPPSGTAA